MDPRENEIRQKFIAQYRREPLVVRSPGRINLIGEHTDYNEGFVMPAAIDKEIIFAIAPSDSEISSIHAVKYDQQVAIDLRNTSKIEKPKWANYLLGVLHQMTTRGLPVKPFHCIFGGDVPLGAGLSSSAALECGFAFALNELFSLGLPKLKLVTMAQWAEHNYAGVKCGIMDQFASVMGKEKHVIVLDCRSLEYHYFPIDLQDRIILLCDTKVKHSLVDSEYNTRRQECEEGVRILADHYPQVKSLRDVTPQMLRDHRAEFPGKVYDRCSYVVSEIARVLEAAKDLERGNLKAFGEKMYETHDGLSRLYEVSCPELDFLVSEARKSENILGARMMGGGFGGCTINIVDKKAVDRIEIDLSQAYRKKFSIELQTYRVDIREGTSVVVPSPSFA
jgi:galactokinase